MKTRRLLIILLCALCSAIALRLAWRQVRQSRRVDATVIKPVAHVSAVERSLRPNYPYSVIPGGAYSPAELRYASDHDRVVHDHYADFDLRSARLVQLTEERYQYVSYRFHDRVFWTRNKLRIPKGEVLLTDGRNFARTRCGNRISSRMHAPTAAKQPSIRVLSMPPFRPEMLGRELEAAPAPPIGELAQEFPLLPFDMPILGPYIPPLGQGPVAGTSAEWPPMGGYMPIAPIAAGYVPTSGPGPNMTFPPTAGPTDRLTPPAPTVIAEVPEPASLYVLGLALCASLWLLTRMMREKERLRDSSTGANGEE